MRKLVLVAAAACALAVASTAAATTPAAYRAKVNALCKVGVKKIEALPAPKATSKYAAYFINVARLSTQLLRQITAIQPPTSLLSPVGTALKLQGEQTVGIAQLAARIETGANPSKALKAAQPRLDALSKQANAAWRKAGLPACAG
jgi:hypothetical protein